ncbi:MAG: reverse transcriptase-like protein [Planctomycetota bacterium]|nr:reverse transcriptase-like protein [Planctomycetota bacterium]
MAWWERHRYRGNKVWIRVDDEGRPALDDRGLAALRYKPDDERTYSVKPTELQQLEEPEARVPDPEAEAEAAEVPPPAAAPEDTIHIYTDGASSGNPGPAGLGVVLLWHDRRREIQRYLGETTNNVAELAAVLDALRAVKRPALPVRLHTDSTYVIGVLVEGHRVRANQDLVAAIRQEMERFADLQFVKVPAHAGVPENERADALARRAIRARG